MTGPPQSGELVDRVVLDVMSTTAHLRLVRLMVSALATYHGADLNDLEDLRIASGELCANVIDAAGDGTRLVAVAEVRAGDDGRSLVLEATVTGTDSIEPFDDISSMVLTAAADSHGLGRVLDGKDRADVVTSSAWFSRRLHLAAVSEPA